MKRLFDIACLVASLMIGGVAYAQPVTVDTSTATQSGNVTDHPIVLPTTVYNGGLLIVMMAMDGNPTVTWDNSSAGTWTLCNDTAAPSNAAKLVIYSKVAAGTEGGVTITPTTSASEQSVARALFINNWEGTLGSGLNCPTPATGTSTTPDPPAATDSWGTVARKTIAVTGYDFSRSVTAYPSGYTTNQFNDVSGGGAGAGLGSAASDSASAGSQDPGTFTIDSSDQWVAQTVSVRGGTAGQPPAAACTRGGLSLLGVGC